MSDNRSARRSCKNALEIPERFAEGFAQQSYRAAGRAHFFSGDGARVSLVPKASESGAAADALLALDPSRASLQREAPLGGQQAVALPTMIAALTDFRASQAVPTNAKNRY